MYTSFGVFRNISISSCFKIRFLLSFALIGKLCVNNTLHNAETFFAEYSFPGDQYGEQCLDCLSHTQAMSFFLVTKWEINTELNKIEVKRDYLSVLEEENLLIIQERDSV